jgi:ribonuclease D
VYHLTAEGWHFKVTITLHASRVEKWIRAIKKQFLDAAPIKCLGLDYEFTDPHEGRQNQRAAVLQLSVAPEILVFHICWANEVSQLLKEFLQDNTIRFCGMAIHNDVQMLRYYGIEIPSVFDLLQIIPNPTNNPIPSLYDLSNATIGTNLEKKQRKKKDKKKNKKKDDKEEEDDDLISGWGNVLLTYEQVKYAALDTRLSFKIARRHWKLHGYNSIVDHLNIKVDE